MSETDRINSAWDRIEKWYSKNMPEVQLHPGASAADIKGLETHLKLTLPESIKASLRRHNGFEDSQWIKSELLSIDGIKREWDCWTGLANEGQFESSKVEETNEKIEDCWWSPSWVPIDADGGGNGNCVDLKPGKNGKVGQVIYMDHETGRVGPYYESYLDYLEAAASSLEAGKYSVVDGYLEENDEDGGDEDEDEDDDDEDGDEGEDEEDEDDEEEEEKPNTRKKVKRN